MPFLGYAASQTHIHPFAAMLAGSIGGTLGSTLIYAAARFADGERMRYWATRGGRWALFQNQDIEAVAALYRRYGWAIVLFGRFVPTVRSIVSVPAGLLPMPLLPFVLFTFLGTAAWNTLLLAAGYWTGANWDGLSEALGTYGAIASTAVFAVAALFLLHRARAVLLRRNGG